MKFLLGCITVLGLVSDIVYSQCGQSSIQPSSAPRKRIINGQTAIPNSWPYIVNIFYDYGTGMGFMCGGSLINPNNENGQSDTILTAAHCTFDENGQVLSPGGYKITLGAQDITQQEATQVVSTVSSVQPNPNYNPQSHTSDVALLKLSAPVPFSNVIQPVCLPASGAAPSNPNGCYAIGWGRISNNNDSTATTLQQVSYPVLPDATCGSDDVWGDGYDATTETCAGFLDGSRSTCQGDSGGPLLCPENGAWTLYGSTSFGNGAMANGLAQCAAPNKPTVFARTSAFIPWITQTASSM